MTKGSLYLIGSLRNPQVPVVANRLRELDWNVFDDWYSAGPHADDIWRDYEESRGNDYIRGLAGWRAIHTFEMDFVHLNRCEGCVLLLPAGRSGHLEFGWMRGQGKWGYIVLDGVSPRWDIMYQFATRVLPSADELYRVMGCPF